MGAAYYEAIVLGGGISGLTAASIFVEQGKKRILLVDQYDSLGGNHISRNLGPYSFDIGSFVFHDDSPFLRRFPFLLEHCLPFEGSTGRVTPQARIARYPFDPKTDLLQAGPVHLARIAASLLWGRFSRNPDENALEFVRYWIGAHLAERTGLVSYLRRFYGTEPSLIEGSFAQKRMNWVSSNARFTNLFKRAAASEGPSSCSLARPREGFPSFYARAGEALRNQGVEIVLGTKIHAIERQTDNALAVHASDFEARSKTVVSTMPLDLVAQWCGMPPGDRIHTSTLTSLFYSFSGRRGFPQNILYNFSDAGMWKRLTMHSDCYGLANGREYFSVEVLSRHGCSGAGEPDSDFRRHTRQLGLFDGNMALEGSERTEQAYPVYLQGATAAAESLIKSLRAFGILSFGRQGGFDYQPTEHVSVKTAERALAALPVAEPGRS
jgi:protoporphyrinogen oxidase